MRTVGLLLLASMAVLTGCAAGDATQPRTDVDLAALVRALPTPAGFRQSTDVRSADTSDIQMIFSQGVEDRRAADNYAAIGFEDAVTRRWRAPDGASMVIVVSRWANHQTAVNVGGGAAQGIPLDNGARAWTPRSLGGARGSISAPGAPLLTTLSTAVADVSVVILATDLAATAPVERTMDLATKSLGA